MQTKTQILTIRINEEVKKQFIETCENYGEQWPEFLREMIQAVVDKTITIKVPPTQLRLIKGVHSQ